MKKYALGALVVLSFIIYSIHSRQDGASAVVVPNKSSANTTTGTQTSTVPSGSGTGTGASSPVATAQYKDGQYTGSSADAYYGYIQVQVTIQNGKLTDVAFLQYPNDRDTSRMINGQAMPYLKQQAIQAQSASVDGVSGATDTSQAFVQSLSSALQQAKA